MGKYKELASNTAIFAISNIISKIVLSCLLPIYVRVLTTNEYGTAELLTTVSSLVVPVFSLAIQDAMFRFGLKDEHTAKRALSCALRIELFSTFLLLLFSFAIILYVPLSNYFVFFFLVSLFTMLRSTLSLYSKTINKTKVFAFDNVLYNLSLAIFNIVFLCLFGMRIEGYFLAIIAANVVSVLYLGFNTGLVYVLREYAIDKSLLTEMIKYSSPLIINSISWGLTHVVDRVMLVSMQDASATGIYSAASKIPSLLSLITGVFSQAWSISAIKSIDRNDDSGFLSGIFHLYNFFLLFTSLIILSVNNNFMLIVLGESFSESVLYIPFLLIGAVFLAYSNFYSPIFAGLKKSNMIMFSALGGAIINAFLNFILIPKQGILGACIATMVSYIFIGMFRIITCQFIKPLSLNFIKLAISFIVLVIECGLVIIRKDSLIISVGLVLIIIIIYFNNIKSWSIYFKNNLYRRKNN